MSFSGDQVGVAAGTLSVGLELACKRGFLGSWKPTDNQIGFCFGFCDAISQNLRLDDIEALAFITVVFEELFKRKGSHYVGRVVGNQFAYQAAIIEGGQALKDWQNSGTPPLVPFR